MNYLIYYLKVFGRGGILLTTAETVEANNRPQSAMTVIVRGIPTKANTTQKALPFKVIGTMFPYPKYTLIKKEIDA